MLKSHFQAQQQMTQSS